MTASAVADIRNTFGAAFIGLFVSSILFGVTIIQAWNYYWVYRRRDTQPLKVFVAIIVFLDCLHTILCFYSLYWYLIQNFGNVDNLEFNMWSMNSQAVVAVSVSFMAQLIYVRRLYILSKRIIVPLVIACAASICLVSGFAYAIKEFSLKRYSLYGSLTWLACVGLVSVFTADILIALSMCWFLYHRRTGYARTDSTIMTLMSYSISSGLLTSVIAAATVASYVVAPTSLLPEAFYWVLVKCHANSLLAMLNSRESILGRSVNLHPENTFYMASSGTTQEKGPNHESMSRPATISVSVHRSTTTDCASCENGLNTEPRPLNVEKSEGVIPSNFGA